MLLLEQSELSSEPNRPTADIGRTWWRDLRAELTRSAAPMRVIFPILLASSVLALEMVAIRQWLDDQAFSAGMLLRLLLAFLAPFLVAFMVPFLIIVLMLILLGIQAILPMGQGKPAKRTLRLEEKSVRLSQTKYDRVSWNDVRRWFLAPVPDLEGLACLTLERGRGTRPHRAYWSILLDRREKVPAFLSEVEILRQRGVTKALVVELVRPMPERKLNAKGLWAIALAFLLFVHGFPLLMVGLMPHDSKDKTSHPTPNEQRNLERAMRVVVREFHVTNLKELRMLFGLSGGALTGAAIGVYAWGVRQQNRQAVENNRLFDLDVDRSTTSVTPSAGFHAHHR